MMHKLENIITKKKAGQTNKEETAIEGPVTAFVWPPHIAE